MTTVTLDAAATYIALRAVVIRDALEAYLPKG